MYVEIGAYFWVLGLYQAILLIEPEGSHHLGGPPGQHLDHGAFSATSVASALNNLHQQTVALKNSLQLRLRQEDIIALFPRNHQEAEATLGNIHFPNHHVKHLRRAIFLFLSGDNLALRRHGLKGIIKDNLVLGADLKMLFQDIIKDRLFKMVDECVQNTFFHGKPPVGLIQSQVAVSSGNSTGHIMGYIPRPSAKTPFFDPVGLQAP